MRPFAVFLCALAGAALFTFPCAGAARAADASVWSALVFASNEDHPKSAPAELQKFAAKLESVFGYNQFELIGQHTELMDAPSERWLIPSKDFSLRVASQTSPGKGFGLKLELYQEAKQLTKFEARLGPQSPLLIRGPLYAGGQLIIVLLVK